MYTVICINRICFCKNTYKMKAMEIFFLCSMVGVKLKALHFQMHR